MKPQSCRNCGKEFFEEKDTCPNCGHEREPAPSQ